MPPPSKMTQWLDSGLLNINAQRRTSFEKLGVRLSEILHMMRVLFIPPSRSGCSVHWLWVQDSCPLWHIVASSHNIHTTTIGPIRAWPYDDIYCRIRENVYQQMFTSIVFLQICKAAAPNSLNVNSFVCPPALRYIYCFHLLERQHRLLFSV